MRLLYSKKPPESTPHHGLHRKPFLRNRPTQTPMHADAALRMDLILRRHGGIGGKSRFSATATLPLPGRDIRATAVHDDLYAAIEKLMERLARRSRGRQSRLGKSRRITRVTWVEHCETLD